MSSPAVPRPVPVRLIAALCATLIALVGMLAVTQPARAADPAVEVSDASLTWRISNCTFDLAVTSCGSINTVQSVDGNVTKGTTGWEFTDGTGSFDETTGEAHYAFTGSITTGNTTRGNYAVRFTDPQIDIDADGTGALTAVLAYRAPAAADFTNADRVTIVSLTAIPDTLTWTTTPPWAGVGTPGDDNTTPVDGKQFHPEMVNGLLSSLQNWFRASATAYDDDKAPGTVALNASVVDPVDPIDPAIPTPPYSGDLGGGSGIPDLVASSTARPITGGALAWGVKASFRAYITGSIGQGSVTTSGGATSSGDGTITWPLAGGTYDPATGQAVIRFGGSARFTGHGGALDLSVSSPVLAIGGGLSTLYASMGSKNLQTGQPQSFNGPVGGVGGGFAVDGDTLSFSGLPVTLLGDAAPAFAGFYAGGAGLDPLDGSFSLGAAAATSTTTQAELAAAAAGAARATTTRVTLTRSAYVHGQQVRAVVKVVAEQVPASGPVTLAVDGQQVTGTLAGGAAVLTLPRSLPAGKHLVAVSFGGGATMLPSAASTTVAVSRARPLLAWKVTERKVAGTRREGVTIAVSIPGAAKSVGRGRVVVEAAGRPKALASARLDGAGRAWLRLPASLAGAQRLTVSLPANAYQVAASSTRLVTVG